MDSSGASGVQMHIINEVENANIVIGDHGPTIREGHLPKAAIGEAHADIDLSQTRLADSREQDPPARIEGGSSSAKGSA